MPRRDLVFGSFAEQGHCTHNLYHRERSEHGETDGSWWGPCVPGVRKVGRHSHQLPAVTDGSYLSLFSPSTHGRVGGITTKLMPLSFS